MAAERGKKNAEKLLGGGDTICISQEMLCLPHAGFFGSQFIKHNKHYPQKMTIFGFFFGKEKSIKGFIFLESLKAVSIAWAMRRT